MWVWVGGCVYEWCVCIDGWVGLYVWVWMCVWVDVCVNGGVCVDEWGGVYR